MLKYIIFASVACAVVAVDLDKASGADLIDDLLISLPLASGVENVEVEAGPSPPPPPPAAAAAAISAPVPDIIFVGSRPPQLLSVHMPKHPKRGGWPI